MLLTIIIFSIGLVVDYYLQIPRSEFSIYTKKDLDAVGYHFGLARLIIKRKYWFNRKETDKEFRKRILLSIVKRW